jgi:hypothetical protein
MWRSRDRDRRTVDCIACDASVARADAREYDKEGDRWERHGKEFEYLCKSCYRDLCHQPRPGLETLLTDVEGADQSRAEFLAAYVKAAESGANQPETESGRD